MFYDGGQEEPQAASTVRPEEEENSFLDRAPPAFLMWGLLALVFSWGSIYMGRWLLPRARQGAVQIRNFFLRWRDGYLAAAGSAGTSSPEEPNLPMSAASPEGMENIDLARNPA
mgnify:CR=1 FL=1